MGEIDTYELRQVGLLPEVPMSNGDYDVSMVPLADLPADSTFYRQAPSPAMVESVRNLGVLQPVMLVKAESEYRVRFGRGRIMAARAAGLVRIPAYVFDDSATADAVYQLAENFHRSPNPGADYMTVKGLLESGRTMEQIVAATGLSKTKIDGLLRLGGLRPELFRGFADGKLTANVALAAAGKTAGIQERLVSILSETGKITAADLNEACRVERVRAVSALPSELFSLPGGKAPQSLPWQALLRQRLEAALLDVPAAAPERVRLVKLMEEL